MAEKLEGEGAHGHGLRESAGAGSYDTAGERVFFDYQEGMIDGTLLTHTHAQDPELFRFLGMFGGIAMLLNLPLL